MVHRPSCSSVLRASVGRVLAVALGAVLLGALAGCTRRAGPTAAEAVAADTLLRPAQVSHDVRLHVLNGSEPRAVLRAGRMERYDTEDSLYTLFLPDTTTRRQPGDPPPGRVRAHIFDVEGDSSATLTAQRLRYVDRDERFVAEGDVVVRTVEGRLLQSEHLAWLEADAQIRTPGFVRITTPTERVEGNGLVADESLETYQIGRFSADMEVGEDG